MIFKYSERTDETSLGGGYFYSFASLILEYLGVLFDCLEPVSSAFPARHIT
jgi:hypothetical protein